MSNLIQCSRLGTSSNGSLLRVRMLIDHLLSDKKAFLDVNPGCVFGDFVRWCSTEDWMGEMDTDEGDKTTNEVGHFANACVIANQTLFSFLSNTYGLLSPKASP